MIPGIRTDSEWQAACLRREQDVARVCALAAPLVALFSIPFLRRAAAYVVNLKRVADWVEPAAWQDPLALAVAVAVSLLPVCWWLTVRWEARHPDAARRKLPLAACLALGLFAVANAVSARPRPLWLCMEAVKVRADAFSYARAVAYWKTRALSRDAGARRLVVVGSSQINFAVNAEQLQKGCPALAVEKWPLPAFGPMQYALAASEFLNPSPAGVVCWLSEFDFFREDSLPTNRLRYFASLRGTGRLARRLGPSLACANRAALADLAVAACLPLWRCRDMARSTLAAFWWPETGAAVGDSARDTQQIGFEVGLRNLARTIRRTSLTEANFAAFADFAMEARSRGAHLIVLEGCSHPDAMVAYDPGFRAETARRLAELARSVGYTFIGSAEMPAFTAADFLDTYHLGEAGSERLTRFLIAAVNRELVCTAAGPGSP